MVADDKKSEHAARRFLKTGNVGSIDTAELARQCDQLVRRETQHSIPTAISLGKRFVALSKRRGDMPLQLAYRSLAWALHVGGKYAEAEKAYLQARQLVAADWQIRGRIDRILIDVYMYLGRFDEARRRARMALNTFRRHGAEEDEAKTRVNYGNLFHRQDRHREASEQYARAAAYFETHGGSLVLGLCYYNQGNTLVQLFDFDSAERLYGKAKSIFADLGYELYVNECEYGLAWLNMLRGNYHVALRKLSVCESAYRKAAQPKGEMLCGLDRAEAFLGLNLFEDARESARVAERKAKKLGIGYESAKAAFFLARALYALGDEATAHQALNRAEQGFVRERNYAFVAATQLARYQFDSGQDTPVRELTNIRRKFTRAQLPLWEAICDLQLLSFLPEDSALLKRLARNPAVDTVPHLFSHWQTHLGDIEARHDRMREAAEHWTQAADMLDAVRAQLPPVELRSAFMENRGDPYLRLIRKDANSEPGNAAVWSERYKTAGIWAPVADAFSDHDARSRAERSLEQLARQVTALSQKIGSAEGKRSRPTVEADRALSRLQREVRLSLAEIGGRRERTGDRSRSIRKEIRSVSSRYPVVQFHHDADDLIAFVHENGTTRSHRYHDGRRMVNEFAGCWNILLGRSMLSPENHSSDNVADERRLFGQIGDWLWAPLEMGSNRHKVLILPDGKLANLPWSAIEYRGKPLISTWSTIISPSFRHHIAAAKRRVRSNRIDVFIGDRSGLTHTTRELSFLKRVVGHNVTIHDPTTRDSWPTRGEAQLWHFTGHAQFRSDNPFYSSLGLADGPMFAVDFRLRQCNVGLVTLAACRTAGQSVLPGEESTGLVRSLLEMGARNVVASHWAVADESTAAWMRIFYEKMFEGLPTGESVRQATIDVRDVYPSAYHWAAFSLFGAG